MTRSHATTDTAFVPWCGALLLCSVVSSTAVCAQPPQVFGDRDAGAHLVARHSWNAARVYTDDERAAPQFTGARLSANVLISPQLQPIVAAILRDSVTFRRQCARFAGAPSMVVTVEDAVITARAPFRALTDFTVDASGRTRARVRVGSRMDVEEIIAHEFEHIIEQLDGVDLRSFARRERAAVRPVHDENRFETERAIAVGRQVVQEIRAARRSGM